MTGWRKRSTERMALVLACLSRKEHSWYYVIQCGKNTCSCFGAKLAWLVSETACLALSIAYLSFYSCETNTVMCISFFVPSFTAKSVWFMFWLHVLLVCFYDCPCFSPISLKAFTVLHLWGTSFMEGLWCCRGPPYFGHRYVKSCFKRKLCLFRVKFEGYCLAS